VVKTILYKRTMALGTSIDFTKDLRRSEPRVGLRVVDLGDVRTGRCESRTSRHYRCMVVVCQYMLCQLVCD